MVDHQDIFFEMRFPLFFQILLCCISPVVAVTSGGVVEYVWEDYFSYALGILLIVAGSAILYTALK